MIGVRAVSTANDSAAVEWDHSIPDILRSQEDELSVSILTSDLQQHVKTDASIHRVLQTQPPALDIDHAQASVGCTTRSERARTMNTSNSSIARMGI